MADDQAVSLHRAGDRRRPGRLLSPLISKCRARRGRDHRPVRCSSTSPPEKNSVGRGAPPSAITRLPPRLSLPAGPRGSAPASGQIKNAEWLRLRNEGAAARLLAAVPAHFPKPVLRHALAARWIPNCRRAPSSSIGAPTRCAPIVSPGRSRAAAARRRAGTGARARASGRRRRRTATRALPGGRGIAASAASRCSASAGTAISPAPAARAAGSGMRPASRRGSSGTRRATSSACRAAAPARRRGRPPRAAIPGAARAPGPCLARPSHLLGRAEPAGDQPRLPRREVLRRSGRARPPASRGAAPPRRRPPDRVHTIAAILRYGLSLLRRVIGDLIEKLCERGVIGQPRCLAMTRTSCLRRRGQLRRRGLEKLVQRLARLRAAAILDVVDGAHERVDDRRRNALLTRKRADSAEFCGSTSPPSRWPGGSRVREY